MTRDVHAYPAERPGPHKADRRCPCVPIAYRDMATGTLTVYVHRRIEP